MRPAVSLYVPCYNGAPWLADCLDALLAQTRPADEVLVIDDGSTDESAAIAGRYAGRGGVAREQLPWFRALAGYRLACLTAHYLRLHQLGRRHDPVWEVFGDGFRPMLSRAHQLLDG